MDEIKTTNADVSIIVPLFHGTGYLDKLVSMAERNAMTATPARIELVFVNDSPDDVPIFSKIPTTSFPVYIVLNERNLGIQRSRIRGMEHSHGKYLFFLDQDDEITNDAIAKLYDAVSGGEISVSDWLLESPHDNEINVLERVANTDMFTLRRFCRGGNIIGPPGHCLIRRDCVPSCWTDKTMKINGADDYYLWIGMLAEGRKFIHCDGNLYTHKFHPGCYSNDAITMLASEDEAFTLAADSYDISRFWRWIYKRNIRYRQAALVLGKKGHLSKFRRRIHLLLYPEILLFYILDKLGIYV